MINESVGNYLASTITPGSKVYWRGYSPVSLLYLPDIQIFPPQLHSDYTYWPGGDPDELLRYGWWNDALSRQWVEESDYILIEDIFQNKKLTDYINAGDFTELPSTDSTAPCRGNAIIRIFKNNRSQ